MRKPIVGIVPLYDEHKDSYWMLPGYMKGIEQTGGIPLMLPLTSDQKVLEQLVTQLDGILFTGGHDIDPAIYGHDAIEQCGQPIYERDEMEKRLFQLAHAVNIPMLGICRGIQMINALMGGTLYQDLPSQYNSLINHQQKPPYDVPVHKVHIKRRSTLHRIVGEDVLMVNSYHHQAIKELAPGCQVMAEAPDGIIEAIEHPGYRYLIAVQWHPEFSYESDKASRAIFTSFIEAAKQTRP